VTNRSLRILLGSIVIAFAAGCGSDSVVTPNADAPQALAAAANNERTLAVELTKPVGVDGGMIFSIDGPNILGIVPASGVELVSYRSESRGRTTLDVLVAGPLPNDGVIAWLTVKGVNTGSPFNARVSQVAAGAAEGFAQRAELSGYHLNVQR
jgi:hypothetical protein